MVTTSSEERDRLRLRVNHAREISALHRNAEAQVNCHKDQISALVIRCHHVVIEQIKNLEYLGVYT